MIQISEYPIIKRYDNHYLVQYLQNKMMDHIDELISLTELHEYKSLEGSEGLDDMTYQVLLTYLNRHPELLGVPEGVSGIINLLNYYTVRTKFQMISPDHPQLTLTSDLMINSKEFSEDSVDLEFVLLKELSGVVKVTLVSQYSDNTTNETPVSISTDSSTVIALITRTPTSELTNTYVVISQEYDKDTAKDILSEDNYHQYLQLRIANSIWSPESLRKSNYEGVITPELISIITGHAISGYSNPYDQEYKNNLQDKVLKSSDTYSTLFSDTVVIPSEANYDKLVTPLMESTYLRESTKESDSK